MYKQLNKDSFFFYKFNNSFLLNGKRNNSEKIIFNFFRYSKQNKFFINNISDLNILVLKKIPLGTVRLKRFGKNYRKVPFLFNINKSYKFLLFFVSSKNKNNKKIRNKNLFLKDFFFKVKKSSKRKKFIEDDLSILNSSFFELNANKINFKYQW